MVNVIECADRYDRNGPLTPSAPNIQSVKIAVLTKWIASDEIVFNTVHG